MGRSLYRIIIRFVFADATADTHRHLQAKTSSIRCQRSSVAAKPGTDVCSRIKAEAALRNTDASKTKQELAEAAACRQPK